ncbi:hypothetical protein FO440_24190 [Mucilaginibacter corticis]|uniref:Uncharacterized protein n=1 Tax=Mucilaginibacter corticis TaxID=2597670 RepID=A0A556M4S5_9SPHI|nr:hypothetical protein [Mucilaginibacter corticis]TSJ34897.1 hypothetical protein FO440_24190 [Mucilaginibacter corticis]
MKKKNTFVNETLSFEDFEQAIALRPASDAALDELVRERLTAEKDAQKKERELKKARNKLH